jgi:hypothetical protein
MPSAEKSPESESEMPILMGGNAVGASVAVGWAGAWVAAGGWVAAGAAVGAAVGVAALPQAVTSRLNTMTLIINFHKLDFILISSLVFEY